MIWNPAEWVLLNIPSGKICGGLHISIETWVVGITGQRGRPPSVRGFAVSPRRNTPDPRLLDYRDQRFPLGRPRAERVRSYAGDSFSDTRGRALGMSFSCTANVLSRCSARRAASAT